MFRRTPQAVSFRCPVAARIGSVICVLAVVAASSRPLQKWRGLAIKSAAAGAAGVAGCTVGCSWIGPEGHDFTRFAIITVTIQTDIRGIGDKGAIAMNPEQCRVESKQAIDMTGIGTRIGTSVMTVGAVKLRA